MNILSNVISRLFPSRQPLPPGFYTYQTPNDAPQQYRLHLRIEPDGSGLLIVNASTVLHLNATAAEFIYYQIKGVPQAQAVEQIVDRYRVDHAQAEQDYLDLKQRIETLIATPDLDPVSFLDFERAEPYSKDISAPYRLDCALTYRQPADELKQIAPVERVKRELSTQEWQSILDKAAQAGIPHIIFTGGEPTLRPDLVDLITYAEKLGMVTGLLTDGLRLAETHYLHPLLLSGLDHIMLLLEPGSDESWEALHDLLPEDIHVTVHITLTPRHDDAVPLLGKLAEMGVTHVSLSASDPSLHDALQSARQAAADRLLTLVWDLPVPYSIWNPVALELSHEAVKGGGSAWLYVEPDGDVLPSQGETRVVGNLLSDPFETVWANRPRNQ